MYVFSFLHEIPAPSSSSGFSKVCQHQNYHSKETVLQGARKFNFNNLHQFRSAGNIKRYLVEPKDRFRSEPSDGGLSTSPFFKPLSNEELKANFEKWMAENAPKGGYEEMDVPPFDSTTFEEKPIMGELEGMDEPLDAWWRKEAEEIIVKAVEKQGLEIYDITWSIHFLNVDIQKAASSITSSDNDFQDDENSYDPSKVTSDDISRCSKAIEMALDEVEDRLEIMNRHTLIVSTPGASDVLRTAKEFTSFKGFMVQVTTGEKINNIRVLKGNLVERTATDLIINQKGKNIKIPVAMVDEVRLPEAELEDGEEDPQELFKNIVIERVV